MPSSAALAKRLAALEAQEEPSDTAAPRPPLVQWIPQISRARVAPLHLDPFGRLLERTLTEQVFAVLHAPPRHGKTDFALHGVVDRLLKRPEHTVGYVTYQDGLARSKSSIAQGIAEESKIKAGKIWTLNEWRNRAGGGMLATSIGGRLTGQGLNLALVDDYFKDRAQAESPTMRRKLIEWFRDVLLTRIEPGGSVIVVATRWHPDDLQGHLLKEGWEHICLPAIDANGKALWQERYNEEALAGIRKRVGEYTWTSLYQGEPKPRGGALFVGAHYYNPARVAGASMRPVAAIDLAYSAKASADESVALWGLEAGGVLYVEGMDAISADITTFAGIMATRDAQAKRRFGQPYTWRLRTGGQEQGIVSLLRDKGFLIHATPTHGDKFQNAQAVSAAWKAQLVLLPEDADGGGAYPFVGRLLEQVLDFTGIVDSADDIVDTLISLWDTASLGGATAEEVGGVLGWQ